MNNKKNYNDLEHRVEELEKELVDLKQVKEALSQSERELKLTNLIAAIFLTVSDEEMYVEVLRVIMGTIESRYGIFGYIDQKGDLIVPSMTRDIWDECQVSNKDIVFPRATWGGIWGQALKEKRTLYSEGHFNVPKGHIPITRIIATPIIYHNECIGIIQVANKATTYQESDWILLEKIASHIAPVLYARLQKDIEEKELKQAEKAIRLERDNLTNILSSMEDGVYIANQQYEIEYVNPALIKEFGHPEGRKCYDYFHDRQEFCPWCKNPEVFTNNIVHWEWHSPKTNKIYDLIDTPIKNPDGSISKLEIFRDITERKQAEEELKARQQEIEELNANLERRVHEEVEKNRHKDLIMMHQSRLAVMGEMIGLIAHQWRQPLNALNFLLYNIQDCFEDTELKEETLDDLIKNGIKLIKKMSITIDDFRRFFTPHKEKVRFSVNNIIKDTLSLLKPSLKYNNISVMVNEEKNVIVAGFPNEYSQVILNILNNAKDAITAREVSGEITIDIFTENDSAIVSIKDNGGGIPENIIDKIFDSYFTTKKGGEGTGIGLYISKIIIEDHMYGSIDVQNINGGCIFTISTPKQLAVKK